MKDSSLSSLSHTCRQVHAGKHANTPVKPTITVWVIYQVYCKKEVYITKDEDSKEEECTHQLPGEFPGRSPNLTTAKAALIKILRIPSFFFFFFF